MADLINREALLAEYDRVHIGEPGKARKLMEDAKAVDAVPVVRCKDCKHCSHGNCWVWGFMDTAPDDFCSCGERRNDNERKAD